MNLYEAFVAFVVAVVAGLSVLFGFGVPAEPGAESVRVATSSSVHAVTRVIDGDTIDIDTGERVRLLGIDTPEIGECYYEESTAFLRAWIEGETVRLERDVRERDVHDRLLRYVFIAREPDGAATSSEVLVNLELLSRGYALSLPIGPDDRYRSRFFAAQEEAQAVREGRWGACE